MSSDDQQTRFLAALKALQRWHADSVKAQTYDGPTVSATKPGARVLRSQPYPSLRKQFDDWRHARSDDEREQLIERLEAELATITKRPKVDEYRDHWGKTRYRDVQG
jgi:hypothetical protein